MTTMLETDDYKKKKIHIGKLSVFDRVKQK